MGLQEVVAWYQKKIGTYDKQAWERTIEQKILHGLTNVPRKSTKLKCDLIDVDLVRGSSFPKAKPKFGFMTVLRLSLLRLIFLPFFVSWWIQETSLQAFAGLQILYILQLVNMSVYHLYYYKSNAISQAEVVSPFIMMLVLSLIHSQIVSTHTDVKQRRTKRRVRRKRREKTPLDDDGFESLNGEVGSSENGDEEGKSMKAKRSALNWKPDDQKIKREEEMDASLSSDDDLDVDRRRLLPPPPPESCYNSSCESEANQEWPGITTNSDDCSYSSEANDQDQLNDHPFAWEFGPSCPTSILGPSCAASDRVSCTIWEHRDAKKADLSVLDISSAIIARVETMPNDEDYFYIGFFVSSCLCLVPILCRVNTDDLHILDCLGHLLTITVEQPGWERTIVMIALVERLLLASLFFFLLAVAERTFKQRFLFAKLFSQLTSSRRARKSELPHFRLNKVRNIKTWLSVRSYLKRRGPQRSVDVIVSAAFIIALLLLAFLSVECLKEQSLELHTQYILEALFWCLGLGVFLLRFMTLGTKINRKYRNLSVLITEQINLYLQIEQKPLKKDELMVANSVLKLAADLLKELECPFKISGLSANPYLYTITKVVILSALSGVLSEMLGFKLKLHKIKI